MEDLEPLKMVESNLNCMQTLVLHFKTKTTPILLVFEEETTFGIHVRKEDFGESRRVSGDFLNDFNSGITLFFVYTDFTEYQNTGDVKGPVLRIINSAKCVENGVVVTTQGFGAEIIS